MVQDIRDVKGPLAWPAEYWWLWLMLAAIAAVAIFFVVRNFSKKKAAWEEEALKKPWEIAYERLEELKGRGLPASGQFKEYYVELSGIVRKYMEDRFDIKAPEMTTEEFLNLLRSSAQLTDEHKAALKDFLSACDMVKFAQYGPSVSEAEQSFVLARRLVEETKIDQSLNIVDRNV